jgi:N-acetylglucosamine malate deacetylase 2
MSAPAVLAVVAHPDDESFGLGALLSEAAAAGSRVGVLCLTHGEASTLGHGDLRVVREHELRTAAERLGACWVRLLDHPDGDLAPRGAQLADDVTAAVRSFSPDVLLVFDRDGISGHPDHVAATSAAVQVGRRLDVPVLAWTLPDSVVEAMAQDGHPGFLGRPDRTIPLVVEVDRAAQLDAVHEHASQAVPGSPLWRRLELLGSTENLVWLHRSADVDLPFRAGQRVPASP